MDEILDLLLASPGQEAQILAEAESAGKISAEEANGIRKAMGLSSSSATETTTRTSSMAPPNTPSPTNHPNIMAPRQIPQSFEELMANQAKPPMAPQRPALSPQMGGEGDPDMAFRQPGLPPAPGFNPTPGLPPATRLGYEDYSETQPGRRFLFENFLNASSGFRQMNPFARQSLARQNDRLQADWATDFARTLMQGGHDPNLTYRDWLSGGSANRVSPGDLAQFSSLFNRDPNSLSSQSATAREFLEENADWLIPTTMSMGVAPGFRNAMSNVVNTRMGAFQDRDLETSLFDEFYRRGGRF